MCVVPRRRASNAQSSRGVLLVVLFDVLSAIWVGAFVGVLFKLFSPHPRWSSWMIAALVGGFGGTVGMFGARMVGVSREEDARTLVIAAVFGALTMALYALISRALLRRLMRQSSRKTRPTVAF